MKANKELTGTDAQTMTIKKGQLYINNEIYRKKIEIPQIHELMDLSEETMKKVGEMQIVQTKEKREQHSIFQAFAAQTTNIEDVRNFIGHIKRKYPNKTHQTVAYSLAGLNTAYDDDYLDDGEHGMGRRLLNIIKTSNCSNITIILTRLYGGTHIGAKRFEITTELANNVVKQLQDGILQKSTLPLRCLIGNNKQLRRAKQKPKQRTNVRGPPIRGGHINHPRFASAAYNRFTMLQNEETSPNDSCQSENREGQMYRIYQTPNGGTTLLRDAAIAPKLNIGVV